MEEQINSEETQSEETKSEAPKEEAKKEERTWSERIEVAGSDLVSRIKELIAEGNVRRLIIRNQNDEVMVEIPLTAGVVAGGVLTMWAPVLAALGAMAALLTRVKVEIVRRK